jgi:4-amino-4-deoxy-L-arabinose transferase-like glycosyltransferase
MTKTEYGYLIAGILFVYAMGLPVNILEVDSAQFSVMAIRMARENDFLHLYRGFDPYLDKPHLHFWLSALSYKIFGISEWAYRLPAFLLAFLGSWSVYGLGKILYNKETGRLAALFYLLAQTIVLAHIDVKTDAVLTNFICLALWKLTEYLKTKSVSSVVIGAAGLALAFSAKGHLALFITGVSLFCYLLYERDWSALWHKHLLWGILAFIITLSPLLYAYYVQFDLHPEMEIRGRTHRSGIKFILFEQTFERMTGEGVGKTGSNYFFFYQNLPWVILPFTGISLAAIWMGISTQWKNRFRKMPGMEFLTLGGILVIFNIISAAQFKLPHYLNGMMPLFAVNAAAFLIANKSNTSLLKKLMVVQYVVIAAGILVALAILFYVFPSGDFVALGLYLLLGAMLVFVLIRESNLFRKLVVGSALMAISVNAVLNTRFYPTLSQYQRGETITAWMHGNHVDTSQVLIVDKDYIWTLDFKTRRHTPSVTANEIRAGKADGKWLLVTEEKRKELSDTGLRIVREERIPYFHISRLSGTFLNPEKRSRTLKYYHAVLLAENDD